MPRMAPFIYRVRTPFGAFELDSPTLYPWLAVRERGDGEIFCTWHRRYRSAEARNGHTGTRIRGIFSVFPPGVQERAVEAADMEDEEIPADLAESVRRSLSSHRKLEREMAHADH